MTKNEMVSYLSPEYLATEHVGAYALSMLKDYEADKEECDDPRNYFAICHRVSKDFHNGLGAMVLAYLSSHFPDTDEADLRLDRDIIQTVLSDYCQTEETLAKLQNSEQRVEFAIGFYS